MKINPSAEFKPEKSIPLLKVFGSIPIPVATSYFVLSENLLIFPTAHFKFCIVCLFTAHKKFWALYLSCNAQK